MTEKDRISLTGKNIICFSSIDWDFVWQGHQEIMSRFAENNNRVLFIENTALRTVQLRDFSRIRQRFINWWKSSKGFRREKENLFIYSPLLLPFPYSKTARWLNRILLSRTLRQWMNSAGFYEPIIWTYLPTNLVSDMLDELNPSLVVYHCIADFEHLSDRPEEISKSERKLLEKTDIVFAQNEAIRQRCVPHLDAHIFPFGVDLKNFNQKAKPAPELKNLKKPIIGYVGGIHRHVDINLIEQLSKKIKGTIAMIGPIQTDISKIQNTDNIVFFGQQPHTKVSEFIKTFDAGIIPYVISEYTKTVYPTKMNEYLAMGIPVVAVDLPDIRYFNEEHKNVIRIADNADSFAKAVDEEIKSNSVQKTKHRIGVAKQNSWDIKLKKMSEIMSELLVKKERRERSVLEKFISVYKTNRRKIMVPAISLLAAVLILFYTPLAWNLGKPLIIADELEPADAIVVFGSGFGEGGKISGLAERVKHAVDIYGKKMSSKIIFASGYNKISYKEAELMKKLAVSLGIPEHDIILETKITNTLNGVQEVRNILNENEWNKIIFVSASYHMRRSLLTWKNIAPEIKVISSPIVDSPFYERQGKGITIEQLKAILHEYAGILLYWFRGYSA